RRAQAPGQPLPRLRRAALIEAHRVAEALALDREVVLERVRERAHEPGRQLEEPRPIDQRLEGLTLAGRQVGAFDREPDAQPREPAAPRELDPHPAATPSRRRPPRLRPPSMRRAPPGLRRSRPRTSPPRRPPSAARPRRSPSRGA